MLRSILMLRWLPLIFFLGMAVRAGATDWYVDVVANSAGADGSSAKPFQVVQPAVNKAQPGDTVHIAAGVYRGPIRLPKGGQPGKPITLAGAGSAVTTIDGTEPLPAALPPWVDCDGTIVRRLLPPTFISPPEPYKNELYPYRTEGLWQNGQRLRFVNSVASDGLKENGTYFIGNSAAVDAKLCPGTAFFAGTVYLYVRPWPATTTNPDAMGFEMTVANYAPLLAPKSSLPSAAPYIVVRDLAFVRAATPYHVPAIFLNGSDHWTIERVVVRDHAFGGIGISTSVLSPKRPLGQDWTTDVVVRDSTIINNGQIGIAAGWADGVTIERNEIAGNNWQHYPSSNEAGGIKLAATQHATVRANFIHDNAGPGIWFDTMGTHSKILDNILSANFLVNIWHEASYVELDTTCDGSTLCCHAPCPSPNCGTNEIVGNVIAGGHFRPAGADGKPPPAGWGAGVFSREAGGVVVRQNLFVGNANGVAFQTGPSQCYVLEHNVVRENVFLHSFDAHIRSRGVAMLEQPDAYCVVNATPNLGATCPAIPAGKSAKVGTTPLTAAQCQAQVAAGGAPCPITAAQCQAIGCLAASAEAFNDPALQNDIDANLYGTTTQYDVLDTLFAASPAVLGDHYYQGDGKKDYLYIFYPIPSLLKNYWNADNITDPTIAFASKSIIDQQSRFASIGATVIAGTVPFVFDTPSDGAVHLFRLAGGSVVAPVTIAATASSGAAVGMPKIEVTHNGRTVSATTASSDVQWNGAVTLSPWENWFAVTIPPQHTLTRVEVGKSTAVAPPTPLPSPAPAPPTPPTGAGTIPSVTPPIAPPIVPPTTSPVVPVPPPLVSPTEGADSGCTLRR